MQSFTGEELEKEFKTSNVTIRKALDILKSDGFVKSHRGSRTTVSEIDLEPVAFELSSSFRKLVETIEKMQSEVKVLEIKIVPSSKYIQDILSVIPRQEVWRMKRIRIYKKTPISVYTYFADPVKFAAMTVEDAKKSNIVDTMEQTMGCKIRKIQQTLRSAVADLDISSILEVPFGAPLLYNENTYFTASDKAVFLSQSYYRGDMFSFKATSHL